jgi:hypothetical protein
MAISKYILAAAIQPKTYVKVDVKINQTDSAALLIMLPTWLI